MKYSPNGKQWRETALVSLSPPVGVSEQCGICWGQAGGIELRCDWSAFTLLCCSPSVCVTCSRDLHCPTLFQKTLYYILIKAGDNKTCFLLLKSFIFADYKMTIRSDRDHGQRYRPRMSCLKKVSSFSRQSSYYWTLLKH